MKYNEFTTKISELYEENEKKLKEAKALEGASALSESTSDEDMAKLRHVAHIINAQNLPYCIFNMSNENIRWVGYADDAPAAVKLAYVQYAYDMMKNMNYTLNSIIGTSSEDYARKKYNAKLAEGGEQFNEIVKDLLI